MINEGKPLRRNPFANEPLADLLRHVREDREDRSLMYDYADEMARRLQALDERHGPEINIAGGQTGICKGCENDWPCVDHRILAGFKP